MTDWDAHNAARARRGLAPIQEPTAAVVPGPPPPPGPGTVLAGALAWFGIKDTGGCGCASDVAEMDRQGPDGVMKHLENWVDRLKAKPQGEKVPRGTIRVAIIAACWRARQLSGG